MLSRIAVRDMAAAVPAAARARAVPAGRINRDWLAYKGKPAARPQQPPKAPAAQPKEQPEQAPAAPKPAEPAPAEPAKKNP
jgi:hypothetical protein